MEPARSFSLLDNRGSDRSPPNNRPHHTNPFGQAWSDLGWEWWRVEGNRIVFSDSNRSKAAKTDLKDRASGGRQGLLTRPCGAKAEPPEDGHTAAIAV